MKKVLKLTRELEALKEAHKNAFGLVDKEYYKNLMVETRNELNRVYKHNR